MEVPVHVISGSLARAAGHARAARTVAAAHQLALGEESLPHARQKCFRLAMLASVLACGMARPDDSWLCPGARPSLALGAGLSVAQPRQRPPQAGLHPVSTQGL